MKLDSRQCWMSIGLGLLGLVVSALVLVAGELVDLLRHPEQGTASPRMIDQAQPVLAGPVELVQGGRH